MAPHPFAPRAARPARRAAAAAVTVCSALALALPLTGCGRDGAGGGREPLDHFPLDAGRVWTYTVTTTRDDDQPERETQTLRALGRDEAGGVGTAAWHRRDDNGVDYWLQADASGVWRVSAKSDVDAEPRPDPVAAPASDAAEGQRRRWVLRAPLVTGTQWSAPTTAYLLMRRAEFPREIRHTHQPVLMTYVIEAVDETVEVPAGRFARCLRVHGTARMRLFADSVGGWQDMPLDTLEWYCPGVGLTRLERNEPVPARSTVPSGGRLVMDLPRWQ